MPRGVYQRSEAHKQKLRERLAAVTEKSVALGIQGRYVRTQKHIEDFLARVKSTHFHGENSPSWKGNAVGYSGVHLWMRKKYGTPAKCDLCGVTTAKRFDWANISGKYKRDRTDWERLCRSCHVKKDGRGLSSVKRMYKALSKTLEGV